jgi:hypothetical protein
MPESPFFVQIDTTFYRMQTRSHQRFQPFDPLFNRTLLMIFIDENLGIIIGSATLPHEFRINVAIASVGCAMRTPIGRFTMMQQINPRARCAPYWKAAWIFAAGNALLERVAAIAS